MTGQPKTATEVGEAEAIEMARRFRLAENGEEMLAALKLMIDKYGNVERSLGMQRAVDAARFVIAKVDGRL